MDHLEKPRISVANEDYVRLFTAVSFATKAYTGTASDVEPEKIAEIRGGIPRELKMRWNIQELSLDEAR